MFPSSNKQTDLLESIQTVQHPTKKKRKEGSKFSMVLLKSSRKQETKMEKSIQQKNEEPTTQISTCPKFRFPPRKGDYIHENVYRRLI